MSSAVETASMRLKGMRLKEDGHIKGDSLTNGGTVSNGNVKTNGDTYANGGSISSGASVSNGGSITNGGTITNGDAATNGDSSPTEEYPTDPMWERHFLPPTLQLSDQARAQKISARLSGLCLSGATLLRTRAVFERELEAGLSERPSSLQMANTYVPELPDGSEQGRFLALDLGGTNFRVLLLRLEAGRLAEQRVQHYHVSDALRLGPGLQLFRFLADCVGQFVRAHGLEREDMSLGFTFSFPMRQHSISSGELVTWTKSFKCGGMEGVDVAALLQRCLDERRLKVTVRVLLNDTTGTLVAGALSDRAVAAGVILGTGSNGCYMERAANVRHWEAAHERVTDVVVDVEWGAFGDNGCLHFLRTPIDDDVDEHALLPGSFTFEKYIGGKYLGCVARTALAALAADRLFPAALPRGSLLTVHLSQFEEESAAGEWSATLATLRRLAGDDVTVREDDARVAQHVAALVSRRAAMLASVCVAALLRRMRRPLAAVALDGSVYTKHPTIRHLMRRYIALLAPKHPFSLVDADDGSGKGSALTAAIAARIQRRENESESGLQ